jgi:putative hydrolase of the HAD superfamily
LNPAAENSELGQASWIVLFDAVGTLIHPHPGPVETYFQFARRFGSKLDQSTITHRFRDERRRFFGGADSDGPVRPGALPSTDEIEKELWRRLVETIISDVRPIEPLFESLWNHFSKAENWKVFSDVAPCLNTLRGQKVRIGIASNFDSRVREVVASLNLLRPSEPLFYSADVGYRKPDPEFYRQIESRLDFSPTKILMVGDDWKNDCDAPTQFGWHALWLDRENRPQEEFSNSCICLETLGEIPDRLREL